MRNTGRAKYRHRKTPAYEEPAPEPAYAWQAQQAEPAPSTDTISEDTEPKSKLPLLAMAAVILLLLAAVGWFATRDTGGGGMRAGEGELAVQSRPPGARVVVDGKESGVTPTTIRLPAGPHVLEVQVGKSEPRVIPLTITAGVQTSQYIELRDVSATGGLEIRSNPPGARITIDGQPRGTTPANIANLTAGDHTVVLELGGRKVSQAVKIAPGSTAAIGDTNPAEMTTFLRRLALGVLLGFSDFSMRKQYVIPAIGLLVVGLSSAFWMVSAADPSETVRRSADVTLAKDSDFLSGYVPARTTIAHLFANHMIQGADAPVLVASIASAMDVRKMRAGQPYAIDRLLDGRVRRFEYEIDNDRRLVVVRATNGEVSPEPSAKADAARFVATVERIPKQTTVVAVEGDINRDTNSLVAALDKAGERIELALGMADVFSGEIDFNSDLQPGDKFRVLVERQTREGKLSGYGAILAAEFVNDGRKLRAIRFTPDGGSTAYYDENGRSLKRFFLKSPLKFEPRITSRFSSSRKHPILGYDRAHNGVDYHAPARSAGRAQWRQAS